MAHRQFFWQATRPSVWLKWLVDSSEISRSNIAVKMPRLLVKRGYKFG